MENILQTIAEDTRRRVAETLASNFPFEKALAAPGLSVIAEVKKASPSKGVIAEEFPYLDIARTYEAAGASAISVLTEPNFFQGSPLYLQEIVQEVSIPVLRKDFIIDSYQIYEAKVLNASAILLICALLGDDELGSFLELAHSLGLSALVEAHDAREIERALAVGARIIGVNNRDLKNFEVDLTTSQQLRELVPPHILFVSESGIKTAEDAVQLASFGVDAVLIGETLMRTPDKTGFIDRLKKAQQQMDGTRQT
jgi:indole-3-glycerol phosphate synthase